MLAQQNEFMCKNFPTEMAIATQNAKEFKPTRFGIERAIFHLGGCPDCKGDGCPSCDDTWDDWHDDDHAYLMSIASNM